MECQALRVTVTIGICHYLTIYAIRVLKLDGGARQFLEQNVSMVCAKCQKLQKSTELATPGVKRRNELYYGSPASSANGGEKNKSSATLGATGIGKVRSFYSLESSED